MLVAAIYLADQPTNDTTIRIPRPIPPHSGVKKALGLLVVFIVFLVFLLGLASRSTTLVIIPEPAWHRNSRRSRTRSRTTLRNFVSGHSVADSGATGSVSPEQTSLRFLTAQQSLAAVTSYWDYDVTGIHRTLDLLVRPLKQEESYTLWYLWNRLVAVFAGRCRHELLGSAPAGCKLARLGSRIPVARMPNTKAAESSSTQALNSAQASGFAAPQANS